MADAIIFDVDGTLVDSVDFHAEAWKRAFAHFGHEFDLQRIRSQIGKGGDQLVPVFLSRDEIEREGKALEAYRKDLVERDYLPRIQGFAGVPDLFKALLARGKRIALASSAKGDELQAYKRAAGIEALIHEETSSEDAERSKPHPDIFQAALDKLGISADRAVVIGDTPYDAEAAGKAGIRSVGVLCGGFADADIRKSGASAIYRDPEDLLANLDAWVDR